MSTEQLKKLAVDDRRWHQWATIDTCCAWQWMTVYCYRCSNVSFINLLTSAALWIEYKDAFIQTPLHSKPSMTASAMSSWALSLASWLASSCLFRWIMFQFVGPWWPPECIIEWHSGWTSGVMVWGAILYHGWSNLLPSIISIETGTFMKCYSPKSFSSFKESLELSFSRIMHAPHMLHRIFKTYVQLSNFFLSLLICQICPLLSMCWIWLVSILLMICSAASKDKF